MGSLCSYYSGCYYFNIICKHSCFVLCKILKGDESIFEPLKKRYNIQFTQDYMNKLNIEFLKLNDRISNENQSIVNKTLVDKYKKLQTQDPKAPYKNKFKYTASYSKHLGREVIEDY